MENWGRLARVVNDDVVDVVIVDDVSHVTPSSTRVFDSLLMVTRWWASTAHAETLAVTDALTLKPALLIVLALLRHRVLGQLLTTPEGALLRLISISVTVYEVVIFLLALSGRISLLSVI